MLATLRKRFDRDEEGFTLIELMVVVLIIAILLAIAIPTFLGARERAQDRAAQSDIRNALTAEKVFYTDNQVYTEDTTTVKSIEPSLSYAATGTKTEVGLDASTDNVAICIEKISAGGTTFSVLDVASGPAAGTYFAKVACPDVSAVSSTTAAPTAGVLTVSSVAYKTGGW